MPNALHALHLPCNSRQRRSGRSGRSAHLGGLRRWARPAQVRWLLCCFVLTLCAAVLSPWMARGAALTHTPVAISAAVPASAHTAHAQARDVHGAQDAYAHLADHAMHEGAAAAHAAQGVLDAPHAPHAPLGHHAHLDCPLCLPAVAPPPFVLAALPASRWQAQAPVFHHGVWASAGWSWPWHARAPPV